MMAPVARILLRYVAGAVLGSEVGGMLAGDPDVVRIVAAGLTLAMTEAAYAAARIRGWAT